MKAKKDILFLCQFFYPEYVSSATLPFDTAVALKNAGFSVGALCGYPREYLNGEVQPPVRETVEGISIRRLKYLQFDRKSAIGRLVNYFSFTLMALLHVGVLREYSSVVVYSNPPVLPLAAVLANMLFGTKIVFVSYDVYPEMAVRAGAARKGSLIYRVMQWINRGLYRRVDSVVALSNEMKQFLLQNRPLTPEQVAVIPNWYQDCKTESKTENRFASLIGGRFTVSYLGNMGTIQDMETILGAVRMLREDDSVFFLFAGHGNKMEALKEIVREENIPNIRIFDFLHGQDYQDALRSSDAALVSLAPNMTGLCVPSKTYGYMMEGIPLLAIMDEGDIVSDIEAGAGRWVRNGDSEGLVKAIRAMQTDPAAHAEMRRVCRELFLKNYTTPICTAKYTDLFCRRLGDPENKKK